MLFNYWYIDCHPDTVAVGFVPLDKGYETLENDMTDSWPMRLAIRIASFNSLPDRFIIPNKYISISYMIKIFRLLVELVIEPTLTS